MTTMTRATHSRRAAAALAGVLAAAALAACNIDTRSEAYACTGTGDCSDGRTCENGWCVVPGGGGDAGSRIDGGGNPADAAGPTIDAAYCPPECDSCAGTVCTIRCQSGNSCGGQVHCPAGYSCVVECSGQGSCGGGVDCSEATECDVQCTKGSSCAGVITCGEGPCDVLCSGNFSCAGGIDCSASCACETDCSGANACDLAPTCPAAECANGNGDCTTDGVTCDTCP
jgi:hypothetical protein